MSCLALVSSSPYSHRSQLFWTIDTQELLRQGNSILSKRHSLYSVGLIFFFYPFHSENFNTAGRNVGTGLTACVICSSWTWAATILQSSNVAYQYGISGPFWYASGATVQILLFGVLAIEVKRKAKNAHTGRRQ